jgi:hypothetical protein
MKECTVHTSLETTCIHVQNIVLYIYPTQYLQY